MGSGVGGSPGCSPRSWRVDLERMLLKEKWNPRISPLAGRILSLVLVSKCLEAPVHIARWRRWRRGSMWIGDISSRGNNKVFRSIEHWESERQK